MYIDMDCSCKGKNLDRFVQTHILILLYDKSMYGLEIINGLEKQTMFIGSRPDRAGVYRYLKKMEQNGHLTSSDVFDEGSKRKKTVYSITDKGKHCLANWAVALGQYGIDILGVVSEIENTIK